MKFLGLMIVFTALLAVAFMVGYKTEVNYEDDDAAISRGSDRQQPVGGVRMNVDGPSFGQKKYGM
ncbi:MAG: hypothetical protein ACI9TY_000128 [Alphaproteobacteria bacterium]|jgi:hypothetical protein